MKEGARPSWRDSAVHPLLICSVLPIYLGLPKSYRRTGFAF